MHTQDASYLDVIHTDEDEWNPSDLAYHLTRRARGLPLWFSLAVNGTDAYTRAVESALELTRWTARQIEASEHLTLLREPTLSIVLFERDGWEPADYDRWAAELLDDQVALVTSTKWEGRTVGRLVFLHPRTTRELVDAGPGRDGLRVRPRPWPSRWTSDGRQTLRIGTDPPRRRGGSDRSRRVFAVGPGVGGAAQPDSRGLGISHASPAHEP